MSEEPTAGLESTEVPRKVPSLARSEALGAVIVVSCAAASLVFSEVGVFVAPLVLLGGLLIFVGARRRSKLAIASGALLVLSPVLAYVAALALLFALVTKQAPIPRAEWPNALSLVASDTATPVGAVEAMSMGGAIDTENVWRLPVDSRQLEQVARDLDASEIPESQVPRRFWDSFPRDMQPPKSRSNRYFISEGFPVDDRGADGDHHLAMYDPVDHQLYVWEISNF